MDTWTDRLSDYVDGGLDAGTRTDLELHLASCDECRATLDDLRLIAATAAALEPMSPTHDLWAGIAAEIGAAPGGLRIEPRRRRSFTFSAPQLAAAALIVLALGAALMWQIGRSTAPVRMAASPDSDAAGSVSLVSTNEPGYDAAIEQLEQAAEQNRDQLDSSTVRILNQSMTTIDRALADARAALARDPANPYLHRHLDRTMKQKLEILRKAATIDRGGV